MQRYIFYLPVYLVSKSELLGSNPNYNNYDTRVQELIATSFCLDFFRIALIYNYKGAHCMASQTWRPEFNCLREWKKTYIYIYVIINIKAHEAQTQEGLRCFALKVRLAAELRRRLTLRFRVLFGGLPHPHQLLLPLAWPVRVQLVVPRAHRLLGQAELLCVRGPVPGRSWQCELNI